MFIFSLATLANAAPVFSSEDARLGQVAREAWDGATACAGWEAPHVDLVDVVQVKDDTPFAGKASVGAGGLARVEVYSHSADDHLIYHEVAHAWANSGPSALVEGATELLARCAMQANGLDVPPLNLPEAGETPELATWENTDEESDAVKHSGYAASALLAEELSTVFGARTLWAPDAPSSWFELRLRLAAEGTEGRYAAGLIARDPQLLIRTNWRGDDALLEALVEEIDYADPVDAPPLWEEDELDD